MSDVFNFLANPSRFKRLAEKYCPYTVFIMFILFLFGLWFSIYESPPDYQQGETVRIMYVHVPAAWMAMMVYLSMTIMSVFSLVWRHPLADLIAKSSAPIGATFTLIALVTGSIWGKPMWGTWWVWDARLTSELILLFLYLGYMALQSAIVDRRTAARAGAILALVGVVNLPIIHFSVEWWSTLHQGPTVTKFDAPSIHLSMLIPLLLMALAFMIHFITTVLARIRPEILLREQHTHWVERLKFHK